MLMMEDKLDAPKRLVGFDSGGEVFLSQGRVLRGIYQGNGTLYRQVLHTCEAHDLFRFGIVATRETHVNPHPDLPYDLVLEHERIPFISYPHEWSASMLKAAALFHIDLYTELGAHGLTIKDWHPYNILFRNTEPVFVDFASIIPIVNLQDEEYLNPPQFPFLFRYIWDTTSAYFYEMYRRMCVPYFLLPLYLMHGGDQTMAQIRLFETTLNAAGSVISEWELFSPSPLNWMYYKIMSSLKKGALVQRGSLKTLFLRVLGKEIKRLCASPKSSAYSGYYSAKGEELSFEPSYDWTLKQEIIYETIRRVQPETLLDVACNTGWFSILAAKLGCKVVAIDIDETCIDILYKRAKKDALSILPLVMDLTRPKPDVLPLEFENEPQLSMIGSDSHLPLLLSADKRLHCDMVIALGIVHHLALGKGLGFADVIEIIKKYTNKYLLIEFVAKEDELITNEPSFFPEFNSNPHIFDWYTLDNFIMELKRNFSHVDIQKSYPDSRSIVICEK